MSRAPDFIRVRGARTHNLASIDVDLPRDAFVVVTGPSGSGKSSLAFATLHAESVRRLASASYVDPRASDLPAPDVDSVEGLPITVGLSQRGRERGGRATLAALSGMAAPLERLYVRHAQPACERCGREAPAHDVARATSYVLASFEGRRIDLLAPMSREDVATGEKLLEAISRAGFARVRVAGVVRRVDEQPRIPKKGTVEVVVDRFTVRAGERARVREAIELAYRTSGGTAIVLDEQGATTLAQRPFCEPCQAPVPALEPSSFRPRSALGCMACRGVGEVEAAPPAAHGGVALDDGVAPSRAWRACDACVGLGIRRTAREATWRGVRFASWLLDPPDHLLARLTTGGDPLAPEEESLRAALARTLGRLRDLGLGHVPAGRRTSELSSGQIVRGRLAGLFASELSSVLYVLDEPTAGLHPDERAPVVSAIRELVERGNGVLCVEHDPVVIRAADYVVELGPGSGPDGGTLVASGKLDELTETSLTRRLLRGELYPARLPARRSARATFGVAASTVGIATPAVEIPVGALVAVTGAGGSGKSSLLAAIAAEARRRLDTRADSPFDRVVALHEAFATASARSLVAGRLGVFAPLRALFAELPEARTRGYAPTAFGLGAAGLRCTACDGRGFVRGEALGSVYVCERCSGRRYESEVALVRYRGASIADVLEESLENARARFEAIPHLVGPLDSAVRLGLGHLRLGRSLAEVSGGERTRLVLAAELSRARRDGTLLLLDEPTRGLHEVDIQPSMNVLHELVERGATVVFADVQLTALVEADAVLELTVGDEGARLIGPTTPELLARLSTRTGIALAARLGVVAENC